MTLVSQSGISFFSSPYLNALPISNTDPFSLSKCAAPTPEMFAQVSQDFCNVVKNMGGNSSQVIVNPELKSKNTETMYADILRPYTLTISPSVLYKLNGCGASSERRMALGLLAHEAAHRILKHAEKLLIEFSKIFQVPLSKKEMEILASDEGPLDHLEKRMNSEYRNKAPNNLTYYFDQYLKYLELERSQEREADLLTMKVSLYARGLRDFFCKQPSEKPSEVFPHHPSKAIRCQYMTDALCNRHPDDNEDICICPNR